MNRKFVADFLRQLRKEMPFHSLKGDWTRRQWNSKLRWTARNLSESIERFRRQNGQLY